MFPKRLVPLIAASLVLVACNAANSAKQFYAHAQAVSTKLESSLGLKSEVGFNWQNGSLDSVTVTFSGVPKAPSLAEISGRAEEAVRGEFKQMPNRLVIAFAIDQ